MHSREDLQTILEEILGSRNVYFQPPSSVQMSYPAIRYQIDTVENEAADNKPYMQSHVYQLTVIDYDPESVIVDKLLQLPACYFNRHYTANDLNHTVLTITY